MQSKAHNPKGKINLHNKVYYDKIIIGEKLNIVRAPLTKEQSAIVEGRGNL